MADLKPADMAAVLERTKLDPTDENCLLPIYEAIANGIYSTQSRWEDNVSDKGLVKVTVVSNPFKIEIFDNGVGLDDLNFDNFRTPFTGFRLKRGGKGFGRFIAFKVFEHIRYETAFKQDASYASRNFIFDIYDSPQIQDRSEPVDLSQGSFCKVEYSDPKAKYKQRIDAFDSLDIVERSIRYFLPFFLSGDMPDLRFYVDGAEFEARAHFNELFKTDLDRTVPVELPSGSEDFQISISRAKRNTLFRNHASLFFADDRIIGSGRDITAKIGQRTFENEQGEKVVYVASVSGEFLNKRANIARTAVEATSDEIDAIVAAASSLILDLESDYVKKRRQQQTTDLTSTLLRNPILRSAVPSQTLAEYVDKKPMSWKPENFIAELALYRTRNQENWEKEFQKGLEDPNTLSKMRHEIIEKLDQENKDALASYVSHRKSVITLADNLLRIQENGKMSLEDIFHDLVHPRMKDSEEVNFYEHNLWLVDEKLSFFSYCSSDRTNHGGRRKSGDKVADLVLFDDCSIYQDGNDGTIVLVEFKRPGRDDYSYGPAKRDPIQQVYETAIKIREEGRLITSSGATKVIAPGVRLYAYVVADLEPSLRKVCKNHNMRQAWDQQGYFYYHDTHDIFVEVIGYDKMVSDAKKRNAAFFDVLLGELTLQ